MYWQHLLCFMFNVVNPAGCKVTKISPNNMGGSSTSVTEIWGKCVVITIERNSSTLGPLTGIEPTALRCRCIVLNTDTEVTETSRCKSHIL